MKEILEEFSEYFKFASSRERGVFLEAARLSSIPLSFPLVQIIHHQRKLGEWTTKERDGVENSAVSDYLNHREALLPEIAEWLRTHAPSIV